MTDLRKLLIEARTYHKHQSYCDQIPNGINGDCPCGLILHRARIDAALAEKVEPVATWETVHAAVKIAIEKCKDASGMRNSIDTFVNAIQITHDVMGTDTIPAPADQWRRVEDGLPTHLHSVLGVVTSGPFCVQGAPNQIDVVSYDPSQKCWLQYEGPTDAKVTVSHWMPLPALPESDK